MQYRDKSNGKVVTLQPAGDRFLLVGKTVEAEGLHPTLTQTTFHVSPSSNRDNVFVLTPRTGLETSVQIQNDVETLKADPSVQSVTPGLIDEAGKVRYALPDCIIVQFQQVATDAQVQSAVTKLGGKVSRKFRSSGLYEIAVPAGTAIADFIESLNALDQVKFAEPCYYGVDDSDIALSISAPTQAAKASQAETIANPGLSWNLNVIDASGAWQIGKGNADILVVIADGMPELTHEAIAGKILAPPDNSLFFSSDLSVSSHATNVTSVVAGESAKMSGVAPGVRVLPVVVNLNSETYADRADALREVVTLAGAGTYGGKSFSRVILSCSWKTAGDIAVIRTALEDVAGANILTVFSAGNDSADEPHFPSDYAADQSVLGDCILSVAATDQQDQKADYSNYSASVSLCAPGGFGLPLDDRDVLCADQGGTYVFSAGTSIAAPHVAAVAALVLSQNPSLTAKQLKALLLSSVDDISLSNSGFNGKLGTGRINARKAAQSTGIAQAPVAQPQAGSDGTIPPASGSTSATPSGSDSSLPAGPPAGADSSPPASSSAGSGLSFTLSIAATPEQNSTIVRLLDACSADLQAQTGWQLTSATVSKNTSTMNLDLGTGS